MTLRLKYFSTQTLCIKFKKGGILMQLITEIDGLKFKKSSFSGKNHNCVGVSITEENVFVTNTKTKKEIVSFTHDEWEAFVNGVKNNEFEIGE